LTYRKGKGPLSESSAPFPAVEVRPKPNRSYIIRRFAGEIAREVSLISLVGQAALGNQERPEGIATGDSPAKSHLLGDNLVNDLPHFRLVRFSQAADISGNRSDLLIREIDSWHAPWMADIAVSRPQETL
jgi:hypothetical protein